MGTKSCQDCYISDPPTGMVCVEHANAQHNTAKIELAEAVDLLQDIYRSRVELETEEHHYLVPKSDIDIGVGCFLARLGQLNETED